jgi:hypothetical protein
MVRAPENVLGGETGNSAIAEIVLVMLLGSAELDEVRWGFCPESLVRVGGRRTLIGGFLKVNNRSNLFDGLSIPTLVCNAKGFS